MDQTNQRHGRFQWLRDPAIMRRPLRLPNPRVFFRSREAHIVIGAAVLQAFAIPLSACSFHRDATSFSSKHLGAKFLANAPPELALKKRCACQQFGK